MYYVDLISCLYPADHISVNHFTSQFIDSAAASGTCRGVGFDGVIEHILSAQLVACTLRARVDNFFSTLNARKFFMAQ